MTETIEEPTTEVIASSQPTAMGLLQMAIDKRLDPSLISQFMDLQDRSEKKKAIEEYALAMNKCQEEMPIVVRDAKNDQTGKRYATLDAVTTKIRPVYVKHGFTLEFGEEDSPLPNCRRIVVDVQHIGGHMKRFHLDSPIDDKGPKGNDVKTQIQGLGSAVTYLRRYLTLMVFNVIIADTDTDGNASEPNLTEEEVQLLETMVLDCENVGAKIDRAKFIGWLAQVQRSPATTFEEVQRRVFPSAVAALQKKMREARKPKDGE